MDDYNDRYGYQIQRLQPPGAPRAPLNAEPLINLMNEAFDDMDLRRGQFLGIIGFRVPSPPPIGAYRDEAGVLRDPLAPRVGGVDVPPPEPAAEPAPPPAWQPEEEALANEDYRSEVDTPLANSIFAPPGLRQLRRRRHRLRYVEEGLSVFELSVNYMDRDNARTNEILRWIGEYEILIHIAPAQDQDEDGAGDDADAGYFNNALSTSYGRSAILRAHRDYRRELSVLMGRGIPAILEPDVVELHLMRISARERGHLAGDERQMDPSGIRNDSGIMEFGEHLNRQPDLARNSRANHQTAQQLLSEAEASLLPGTYPQLVADRFRARAQRYRAAYDGREPWPGHPSDLAIARMDSHAARQTNFRHPTTDQFAAVREDPRGGDEWLLLWSVDMQYRADRLQDAATIQNEPGQRNPGLQDLAVDLRRRVSYRELPPIEPPPPRRRRIGGHDKNGVMKGKVTKTAKSRPDKMMKAPLRTSRTPDVIKLPAASPKEEQARREADGPSTNDVSCCKISGISCLREQNMVSDFSLWC